MSDSTIVFFCLGIITLIAGLIIFLKKTKHEKKERQWMEEDFDETAEDQADNNVTVTEGQVLDNGDFIGEARVVKQIDLPDNDIADDLAVINEDAEEKPSKDATAEPIIGDIDLSTENKDDNMPQLDLLFDEPEQNDVNILEDYEVQEANPDEKHSDPSGYVAKYSSDEEYLNSPLHTKVALTILAQEDDMFEGADLVRDFTGEELSFHMPTGFYCYAMPGLPDKQLFCVANILEPGTFDPVKMSTFKTKGILLFMSLPNKIEPSLGFEKMYEATTELAKDLGGVVCDSDRNQLSDFRLEQIRDDMRELELKIQIESKKRQ